jgi:hypothetical protein
MPKNRTMADILNQADVVNGFWNEFEDKYKTQDETHPWKLKYFVAVAFAEGVAAGLRHGEKQRD